jgi:hypothetical protein
MLKFDRSEFRNVARAILAHNKYAKGDTIDNIVSRMESLAHYYDPNAPHSGQGNAWHSFVATYGFLLLGYIDQEGNHCIKAAVSDHLFAI